MSQGTKNRRERRDPRQGHKKQDMGLLFCPASSLLRQERDHPKLRKPPGGCQVLQRGSGLCADLQAAAHEAAGKGKKAKKHSAARSLVEHDAVCERGRARTECCSSESEGLLLSKRW